MTQGPVIFEGGEIDTQKRLCEDRVGSGVMLPQAKDTKDGQEPPEARERGGNLPLSYQLSMPASALVLGVMPPGQ